MSDTVGILSLFISSFLAATLLPGGSEAALFAVLKAYPETLWYALVVASIGNTLGGMVTFGMGRLLPLRMCDSEAADSAPVLGTLPDSQPASGHGAARQLKHVEKLRRYGTPALLLAWVPLIGDALCLTAGWLRLNPWQAALFMAIGKFARYGLIAFAMS